MGSSRSRPFDYSIDTAARLVSVRVEGILTFCTLVNYASSLRADPRFSPAFSEIVDLRGVESVALGPRESIILADHVDPFSFNAWRAFVVESQAQMRAAQLHRMLRRESKTMRVFFSMDEARRWIECGEGSSAAAGV